MSIPSSSEPIGLVPLSSTIFVGNRVPGWIAFKAPAVEFDTSATRIAVACLYRSSSLRQCHSMTRTVLYYIAAGAFAVAAVASGIGQQWILAAAFVALAAMFLVIGIRSPRIGGR